MSKSKRTKATEIPYCVKTKVWERDGHLCIFCHKPGLPEGHVVPRSHSGLGIETNIITVCRPCHNKLDNSTKRAEMLFFAERYLKFHYPDWKREDQIYDKWRWMREQTDMP